jgi:hypothetical protein
LIVCFDLITANYRTAYMHTYMENQRPKANACNLVSKTANEMRPSQHASRQISIKSSKQVDNQSGKQERTQICQQANNQAKNLCNRLERQPCRQANRQASMKENKSNHDQRLLEPKHQSQKLLKVTTTTFRNKRMRASRCGWGARKKPHTRHTEMNRLLCLL